MGKVCDECGGDLKDTYWEVARFKKGTLGMQSEVGRWRGCNKDCAWKIMDRVDHQ